MFYLARPVTVTYDQVIVGKIAMRPMKGNYRAMTVAIELFDIQDTTYLKQSFSLE